jgi:uncharacterized protein YfbU (UPF0304 family)
MKINFDKIICVNSGSLNDQQLFAVCETYFIGFESIREAKMAGVTMKWLNEECEAVAFVLDGRFTIADKFNPLSKKEYDRIKKIKPVKTPKMPKTASALNNYKAFLSEGYDIKTKSLDSKLNAKSTNIATTKVDAVETVDVKIELPVVLELDAILEKIFKYGIASITAEEKDLLDNQ